MSSRGSGHIEVAPATLDVGAYLRRIDHAEPVSASIDTLHGLHLAHLYAVPFENLDIHLGRPIVLNERSLYDKIVKRRRGGFCYELNGLFAWLLRNIGFDVAFLSAQVAREVDADFQKHSCSSRYAYSEEFDHLMLRVRSPEDGSRYWLADVGFGDSFLVPLAMQNMAEQEQQGHVYWLAKKGESTVLWRRSPDGKSAPQVRFGPELWVLDDFRPRCEYHQTSPSSIFTQRRICSLAIPQGRVSLTDSEFVVTTDGERRQRSVRNESERTVLLRECFGVDLTKGDS